MEPTQYKIKLQSGKIVVLREPLIKDQEHAAMAASPRANGDSTVLQVLMQGELMKLLIVSVDGKVPSAQQKEQLDGLFTLKEYTQLAMAAGKITGSVSDLGEYQLEVLTSGAT
jgi:hypothetical protein